jgi:hypothetical protein
MDIGIEVRCHIATRFVPLDAANDHDCFAGLFPEYPVDVKFMVRIGQENLVDYLGLAAGMTNKKSQKKS